LLHLRDGSVTGPVSDEEELIMRMPLVPTDPTEEQRTNLVKDGGRTVLYGGDPYEDDVERLLPSIAEGTGRGTGRTMGPGDGV